MFLETKKIKPHMANLLHWAFFAWSCNQGQRMELDWAIFQVKDHGQFVQQFRIIFRICAHQLPQSELTNSW